MLPDDADIFQSKPQDLYVTGLHISSLHISWVFLCYSFGFYFQFWEDDFFFPLSFFVLPMKSKY